jgi:tetratricopeptide (TPR) repeat protein
VRSAPRLGGLVMAASLSVVGVCVVHAQQPPGERVKLSRIDRLEAWIAAVERHELGELDESVLVVNEWAAGELRFLWFDLTSLTSLVREPAVLIFFAPLERPDRTRQPNLLQPSSSASRRRTQLTYTGNELRRLRAAALKLGGRTEGRENALLKRGAVLHSDIAMLAPTSSASKSLGGSGLDRYLIRMDDGRQVGLDVGASQWEMARRLLDGIATRSSTTNRVSGPEADPVARAWYLAAEAHMQSIGYLDPVNCGRAVELFPKDAEVLFFCAAMHEVAAGSRRQEAIRTADIPGGVTMFVGSRGDELAAAERLYRLSLEANGDFGEARIRYARVLGQRGRHAEAVDELRKITSANEPMLEYYAALFLAGELEALGREDDARQAYVRAVKVFPLAQSPRLGLSRLDGSPVERQAARSAALALVADRNVDADRGDPWWTYEYEQGRRHRDGLLERLYDAVRKERLQ